MRRKKESPHTKIVLPDLSAEEIAAIKARIAQSEYQPLSRGVGADTPDPTSFTERMYEYHLSHYIGDLVQETTPSTQLNTSEQGQQPTINDQ